MRRVAGVLGMTVITACTAVAGVSRYENGDSVVDDGGADAGEGGEASAPFCATHADATFCADFEGTGDVAQGWSKRLSGVAASLARDTTASASGAASLVTRVAGAPGCTYADLTHSEDGPARNVHFELAVRLAGTDGVDLQAGFAFSLGLKSGAKGCFNVFNIDGKASRVEVQHEGAQSEGHPWTSVPMAGEWSRIAVDLVERNGAPALTVHLNDQQVLDLTPANAPAIASCALGGTVDISVGTFCSQGTNELHVDDVALYVR